MAKLNRFRITLGGNIDSVGKSLCEMQLLDVYEHKQPVVYYESGIPSIERFFYPDFYIKKGYVTTLVAYVNSVSVIFLKFESGKIVDSGIAHIIRNRIIKYEVIDADNLEVIKREGALHEVKYIGKRLGLIGALAGLATKSIVSVNTLKISGARYKLYYLDEEGNENCIILYSSNEYKEVVKLFLNTFYTTEVPKENR